MAAHLVFSLVLGTVLVPVMALAVRLALKLSGQPALADFDIAVFLLSPVGFVAFLFLAGFALFLFVLDVSFMMAIVLRERHSGETRVLETIMLIVPRMRVIVELGMRLTLRVLAICLPFLAVAGAAYFAWMTEFDINYYLSNKPQEFTRTLIVAGAVLAVMAIVLLRSLIRWTLTLPLVVFGGVAPKQSFAQSAEEMRGQEIGFGSRILVWIAVGFVVNAGAVAVLGVVTNLSIASFAGGLQSLVLFLLLFAGLGAVVNFSIAAMTTGALATLIVARAGWPGKDAPSVPPIPSWAKPAIAGVAVAAVVLTGIALTQLARVEANPEVQVIAHRGAAGAAPENTMASILRAIEDEADWIEIDVQETADGKVVVVHDSDFMKIAGVNLRVWDATMPDLAEIDIGSWFDPAFSDERTPLLSEVLDLAKGRAGVVIELKYYGHDEMLEQRVADLVEAADMVEHVRIMSLKYSAVQKMRALRPDWNIGLLASASLGRMWELDADFLAVNGATTSHRLVRETRAAGKETFVWTINDALSMSQMISKGVDGLITDEPALARKTIAEHRELNLIERMVLGLAGSIGLDLKTESYRDDSP
ncbi:glycerophosphodiester phosphodiesterase family protein [Shimia abyssi]|uniref:glycerophosphodiester phosphodiesterase family protein n=1 Tax=Shimia abyssi TaxID=1662395 RepID=UPI0010573797|nr:glycerophosphodiester phosphodiesterase family protein [Shimia abyssi]